MAHINLQHIRLQYPVFETNGRFMKQKMLSLATGGRLSNQDKKLYIEALGDISLHLKDGDRLGIIGHNGAGKSTLLKLIAGVYTPQAGRITVAGKISALLDLDLGMEQEATGYENIYLRALILGYDKKEVDRVMTDIVQFTEMGDYLRLPIKTYSTGMRLRLAFAISTALHAEIMLVDEVIGVGDAYFKEKARARMKHLVNQASILIVSTHDHHVIRDFCNQVIWLEHGRIQTHGETETVLSAYEYALRNNDGRPAT